MLAKMCPKCGKKLIKVVGEGYDTAAEDHFLIRLARVCKYCQIIFINPNFQKFKIEYNEIGV